ncbi:MAG TPA: PIN domain-containing protein [Bryobacteraceae bacterium]|nr:PIN domain-containing protein [Bryobacteraceae bacterium]
MALIADSGAIYALYDARDRHHAAVTHVIDNERETIIVPMALLAEIDYLLRVRLGSRAVSRFLEGIQVGGYTLEPFTAADVVRCKTLLETYADLDLGLADTSVIAAAERLNLSRILTVDERHFRAIRGAGGKAFTLLPADA